MRNSAVVDSGMLRQLRSDIETKGGKSGTSAGAIMSQAEIARIRQSTVIVSADELKENNKVAE